MADDPLNVSNTRLQYADWAKERGMPSGELFAGIEDLRGRLAEAGLPMQVARPDQLALLRGATLTEEECAAVAAEVRSLLGPAGPAAADAQAIEARLSTALGPPQRSAETLNPLDPEQLRSQYNFQRTLLASLDLLEEQGEHPGITGVDGVFHPLPLLADIEGSLASPTLQRKVAQGFSQLLLVPFALPLKRLLAAWHRGLLRNEHLLQPYGGLDRKQPLWVWKGYDREELVYFPQRFEANHGGRTKEQLLASDPAAGWQVLLTECALIDVSRAGQGQVLAGRRQIATDRSARQYLATFPRDETGWTPETYALAFLSKLERAGRVLDRDATTLLTCSYLPASGNVPYASWLWGRQADLDGGHPDFHSPQSKARAAVRVL